MIKKFLIFYLYFRSEIDQFEKLAMSSTSFNKTSLYDLALSIHEANLSYLIDNKDIYLETFNRVSNYVEVVRSGKGQFVNCYHEAEDASTSLYDALLLVSGY